MSKGLLLAGDLIDAPGLDVTTPLGTGLMLNVGQTTGHNDGRLRRTPWVRNIILHTTKGIPWVGNKRPQDIRPGLGPDMGADYKVARYWSTSHVQSGAHLVIDHDGSILCVADLMNVAAYHAGEANEWSIGIELYQGEDAELYEGQLDACVALVDLLCRRFRIQRQYHYPYAYPLAPRLETGGRDCVGVFGHRDLTDNRGPGDPGDAIFERLSDAGFESFDFAASEDIPAWQRRQELLNAQLADELHGISQLKVDGIPGPKTARVLEDLGYSDGLYCQPNAMTERELLAEVETFIESLAHRIDRSKVLATLRKLIFSE